jgi:dienelactone hydrolase
VCLCSGVAEVVVFHHTLGLTGPVRRFARELRAAGHTVHTPDLYDGRTFETYEDGSAHSETLGGPMAAVERARAEVESLPSDLFSASPPACWRRSRSLRHGRARAARCSAIPPWRSASGATTGRRRGWAGVRLQLHILEADEDYEIAQGLATTVPGAELFVYPGTDHLFAEHDEQAAALLRDRVLEFLG